MKETAVGSRQTADFTTAHTHLTVASYRTSVRWHVSYKRFDESWLEDTVIVLRIGLVIRATSTRRIRSL